MSNIAKVRGLFRAINGRDPAEAARYVDPARYVDHDPNVAGDVEGLKRFTGEFGLQDRLSIVRIIEDGACVVAQSHGRVRGDGIFFDVFRFEDGWIVEHWGFAAPAEAPNKSGHTQVDGPTEPRHEVDTDRTKALVREYYETVHLAGRHDQIPRFMANDRQIRHEPGVADGVGEFERDLEVLTRDRTIDELVLFVGQGDFVFLASRGTHRGAPCAYIDLYRVEDDTLVEHWGFPKPEPDPNERMNRAAML